MKWLTAADILTYEKVNPVGLDKVAALVRSIQTSGWHGAPILTYGNTLLTGSHRLAALQELYHTDDDFDPYFDCAVDVSDIIEQRQSEGWELSELLENTDNLRAIFEGTWVERHKDELAEW